MCRSSSGRPAAANPPRSPPSTRAPTTTSPSRSGWMSCWPACAAAIRRGTVADEEPAVATEHFTVDLAAKCALDSSAERVRLTPTEWQLLEVLVRHHDKLVTHRQ